MITLTDIQLADIIGKEATSDGRIFWLPSDLAAVKIALKALQFTHTADSFLIDSVMPYWLYVGIMSALAPKAVSLNTPNFGPVLIPQNTPEGSGAGLPFRVYEDAEFTLVRFSSPRHLQSEQLSSIIPPKVNPAKGVVISSNAPPWIIATVGLAYSGSALWTACTQKFGNAVVFASREKNMLGTEIERSKVQEVLHRAGAPKRGEIWLFDDGYKERPGVVISLTLRNEQLDDVLIVPFTTSEAHAHRHLAVGKVGTGLAEDSYAQCSNISRIEKEQLLKGPVGTVPDELMNEIVRAVRQAIGDQAA